MLRSIGTLGLCCLCAVGCIDAQKQKELAEKTEKDRDLAVATISDVADFGNAGPLQVHGVGLVTGLAGTGHSPEGNYRKLMEQILLKTMGPRDGHHVNEAKDVDVNRILDNPNNCLVIVSGFIPAGARKGDHFDVDITLPAGSRASSLAGGTLHMSLLRVYEAVANITQNPAYKESGQLLPGHVFASAKGPLIVAFGNNVDANELKKAKVWLGGASHIARPYHLVMRTDDKSVKVAAGIADRINFMYQDDPTSRARHSDFSRQEKQYLLMGNIAAQLNGKNDPSGMNDNEMAKAMNKEIINVRVPVAYRFNHERFRIVSSMTPLRETDPGLPRYRGRAQKMLLDPQDAMGAAMRLEALGRDSVPYLKAGLESDHPYVRFASAEALAYLGSTAGVDALTQLAQQQPVFAKACTIALASLGETVCRDKLGELLTAADPTLQRHAFHALALVDETDRHLGGVLLGDSVWLHRIPQAPHSQTYFAVARRPQIVLFGKNIVLTPNTRMIVGSYTVAPGDRSDEFFVKRITAQGEERRISTNRLDDVLVSLVELKASYPDLIEFLRKASDYQNANCPIAAWSLPETPLQTLIEAGRRMKSGQ